jgi:D-alanine-D-alanine ligase
MVTIVPAGAVPAGVVPADEAFSGFGHPAVITVACVLVLSRGLQTSGAVDALTRAVLPAVRIVTPRAFYDYEAKYFSDDTRYHCPCGLAPEREAEYAEQVRRAFAAVGASGWGRVDFLLPEDGVPRFLEVNTIPGMTSHSLVPMGAREAGIDFDELVWRVLETSFDSRAAAEVNHG